MKINRLLSDIVQSQSHAREEESESSVGSVFGTKPVAWHGISAAWIYQAVVIQAHHDVMLAQMSIFILACKVSAYTSGHDHIYQERQSKKESQSQKQRRIPCFTNMKHRKKKRFIDIQLGNCDKEKCYCLHLRCIQCYITLNPVRKSHKGRNVQ